MIDLYKYITESQNINESGEVKNAKFLKLMKAAGLEDYQLCKGSGYFYISSETRDDVYSWYENAIYINSFNQQSPEEWVEDIKRLIEKNKEMGR